ncbi:hypothetical protein B0H14DRAFT_1648114 [Mycena olivaceomarginata]|nr:hypothetical protein B0H14DRAFT_1648114 [Mycena olivaceomarginata]
MRCPVRARVASVRHYTLVAPIRLRGVAAGNGERERSAGLLSWDAEGSSSSAWLSLTSILGPRSPVSVPPLQPHSFPAGRPPSSSLLHDSGHIHPVFSYIPSPPLTPFPELCDRALPATGYRGPRRRAYTHSEPCSHERAGCGWTGRGRVGRREACMALSTSPSCVVLSIFEWAVRRILGGREGD